MADVVLAWWTGTLHASVDEHGTTVVELMMIVALFVAAVVLVSTFGASLAGDTI